MPYAQESSVLHVYSRGYMRACTGRNGTRDEPLQHFDHSSEAFSHTAGRTANTRPAVHLSCTNQVQARPSPSARKSKRTQIQPHPNPSAPNSKRTQFQAHALLTHYPQLFAPSAPAGCCGGPRGRHGRRCQHRGRNWRGGHRTHARAGTGGCVRTSAGTCTGTAGGGRGRRRAGHGDGGRAGGG
jgi:hypothetical protein